MIRTAAGRAACDRGMNGRLMASPTTPLPLTRTSSLAQAVGLHAVAGVDVGGTHDAADGDGLALGVDLDVLGGLDQQRAVGQNVDHPRGQRGAKRSDPAGGALSGELGIAGEARQVGERAGGFGDARRAR